MGIRSNNSAQSFFDIFTGTGSRASAAAGGGGGFVQPNGHTASGGIISDYEENGTVYRSHTFITPGTFEITALSSVHPANIDYLVVGGGGGGGGNAHGADGQGAGGAGGLRSNHPLVPAPKRGPAFPVSVATYNVEIGNGAFGGRHSGAGANPNACLGRFGEATNFYVNGASFPNAEYIKAGGGGRGGAYGADVAYRDAPAAAGSGGGGAGGSLGAGGPAPNLTDPNYPQLQGNPGGNRGPNWGAGGGGGFIGAGQNADSSDNPGAGGTGIDLSMESVDLVGYAGGGSGGGGGPGRVQGTVGAVTHGGGAGGPGYPNALPSFLGGNGLSGTGGGGGGGSGATSGDAGYSVVGWGGGAGGPGIVVVRYEIGQKNTAKATGGAISFYNGKTIHTFRHPGTFTASEALTCEFVLIGGGGGGGYQNAGGGGAGGYQSVTGHSITPGPYAVTVGEYGQGNGAGPNSASGSESVFRNGGSTSFIGTGTSYTVKGGGAGGNEAVASGGENGQNSPQPNGGSGGGGGRNGTGGVGGTFGNPGGAGITNPPGPFVAGGGGGGAGGSGQGGDGPTSHGGHGGLGVQLPATFQDPAGFKFAQGPNNSYFWVAGGGGGGSGNPGGTIVPKGGTGPSGAPSPRCGGGGGGSPVGANAASEDRVAPNSTPGMMGTGGGGGGGGETQGADPYQGPRAGSPGGSGIFMIAYPT